MATVLNQFDPNQDQNKQTQQGQNPTINTPTIGGPQGGGVATPGASGSPQSPAGTSSGTSSGRFNNLQKYIQANKGFNEQGGGLGGQIAGNITQQAQNVQQNVQGAQQTFQNQAQNQVNSFTNPSLVNKAFQNPVDFTKDQQNLQQFNAIRDAEYKGPKSLQDLQGDQNLANLQVKSANVNDLVNQGQSEGGRFNLLKSMYGKPSYTSGQQNLDNLLLQTNKDQMNKIQGVRQTAMDTNRQLTQAEQTAQQTARQAQQQAQQVQQQVRGQTNQAVDTLKQDVMNQLPTAQKTQQEAASKFAQQLKGGYISPEDLARLQTQSPDLKAGMNLYGADIGQYVQTSGDIRPETLASADQYAKFNALNQLLGNTANEQSSATLAQFNDPTLAGKMGPLYGLDVNRALGEINAHKEQYNTQNAAIQQAIDASNAALHGGDPTLPWAGGIEGETARRATAIRQQMDQYKDVMKNNPALASSIGLPAYQDFSKLSDAQMLGLSGLGGATTGTESAKIAGSGSNWDLLQGLNYHNAQLADQQQKYQQLQKLFNIGKGLTTTPQESNLAATLPATTQSRVLGSPTELSQFTPTGPVRLGDNGPVRLR